jgi:putative hydrolase of the HAD superfamily
MKKQFLFDLDDTLIETCRYYARAKEDLVAHTNQYLGEKAPSRQNILDLSVKIDLTFIREQSFSQERFPSSISKTFEQIAQEVGLPQKLIEQGREQAYEIGMQVHNPINWETKMLPGAEDVLNFLRSHGDELYLVTAGDVRAQTRKINFYGLYKWFGDKVHIVAKDKRPAIKEITKKQDTGNVYFVGNSPSSDIMPALECGINAIHIPKTTWDYDNHPDENNDHHRKITIPRISEIIAMYATEFS